MDLRRIFPIAMGAVLLIIASTSAPAAALLHCNNKVCTLDGCGDQINGPGTHCLVIDRRWPIPNGCAWDICTPH